jgi:putative endonuclease
LFLGRSSFDWSAEFCQNGSGYTTKPAIRVLMWFEETDDVSVAIAKEKQIKTSRRQWKMNLVEFENP